MASEEKCMFKLDNIGFKFRIIDDNSLQDFNLNFSLFIEF